MKRTNILKMAPKKHSKIKPSYNKRIKSEVYIGTQMGSFPSFFINPSNTKLFSSGTRKTELSAFILDENDSRVFDH